MEAQPNFLFLFATLDLFFGNLRNRRQQPLAFASRPETISSALSFLPLRASQRGDSFMQTPIRIITTAPRTPQNTNTSRQPGGQNNEVITEPNKSTSVCGQAHVGRYLPRL